MRKFYGTWYLVSHSQDGAVGSELFNGISWITKKEARNLLKQGRNASGIYYPAITWIAMTTFLSDLW
ncbi:hypothetical protein P261_02780 [Lachnospiraceae bacterium TWA4]|nr:hypothetical protein P261_02780 [Lachnospiraceae bacterium TWA4]